MSLPITVVCGPHRSDSLRVARRLLAAHPRRVLVEHDLAQVTDGLVGRTELWGDGRLDAGVVELAHGCVACTVREDVLPALVRLAATPGTEHVVLLLPDVVEPAGFIEAFHGVPLGHRERPASDDCHVSRLVTVVDAEHLVPTVAQGLTLAEAGRAAADADDRTLGELVVRQLETADVVVLSDAGPTERAVVASLNPGVRLLSDADVSGDVLPVDTFDLHRALDRGDPSVVPVDLDRRDDVRRCGDVWSITWQARKPFHPARLGEALTHLTERVLRSRGTIWIAGHPGEMVGWDGVGPRIGLGVAGSWLEGARPCAWDHAHRHHRVRAELDWDPVFGDRHQELLLVGIGEPPHQALAALNRALLTHVELQATSCGRRPPRGVDPFADVFAPAPGTAENAKEIA
jgi:G3E family GTPase